MSNPIIGGLDAATGIVTDREMTDEETAANEALIADSPALPSAE
jgi:hypothetical protein